MPLAIPSKGKDGRQVHAAVHLPMLQSMHRTVSEVNNGELHPTLPLDAKQIPFLTGSLAA